MRTDLSESAGIYINIACSIVHNDNEPVDERAILRVFNEMMPDPFGRLRSQDFGGRCSCTWPQRDQPFIWMCLKMGYIIRPKKIAKNGIARRKMVINQEIWGTLPSDKPISIPWISNLWTVGVSFFCHELVCIPLLPQVMCLCIIIGLQFIYLFCRISNMLWRA